MRDHPPVLTRAEMDTIAGLVREHAGIRLSHGKTALVNARLQKKLREYGFRTFSEYLTHVRGDRTGRHMVAMIDALTTNHTSFFREADHFRFLADRVLPELQSGRAGAISAWSAGCATGEEAYSIAMTCLDWSSDRGAKPFHLVATDISTAALAVAVRGVYAIERVAGLPRPQLQRYFERGVGGEEGLVRVQASLRARVRFEHANLLEPRRFFASKHVIFCRNVLMYFDEPARRLALMHLVRVLAPGGYLFVSHTENLSGLPHGLARVSPSVYRRSPR